MEYRITRDQEYLAHYGVKGQKHGIRNYQNPDGSLTAEGRDHYGVGKGDRYRNADSSLTKKGMKEQAKFQKWQQGVSGKYENNRFNKKGLNESDLYGSHKVTKAAIVGTLLAGPLVGVTAGLISNHRYKKGGKAFIDSLITPKSQAPKETVHVVRL